jgi:hypothetical protein
MARVARRLQAIERPHWSDRKHDDGDRLQGENDERRAVSQSEAT